ncbi:MAG: hypothetical protein F6K09_07655 [Merismopedia sp. SIO2A8]|nr:hypothetical protein [Merismopedia sp. SIO2A8]
MARSDFNWIGIGHNFTVNSPSVSRNFPIEGSQNPTDDAYLLVQVRGVGISTHSIRINDTELGGFDLAPAPRSSQAWLLWMDHIPSGVLRAGTNEITITRQGNDDFEINGVVVNWREPG